MIMVIFICFANIWNCVTYESHVLKRKNLKHMIMVIFICFANIWNCVTYESHVLKRKNLKHMIMVIFICFANIWNCVTYESHVLKRKNVKHMIMVKFICLQTYENAEHMSYMFQKEKISNIWFIGHFHMCERPWNSEEKLLAFTLKAWKIQMNIPGFPDIQKSTSSQGLFLAF